MKLKISEIAQAVNGRIEKEYEDSVILKVTQDSRNADRDSLFVPIIGERLNGHNYIKNAADNGCIVTLSAEPVAADICVIYVEDTEKALGALASYWIEKVKPVKIAVTGSVGKTTTRDMIGAVVKKAGKTLKTMGNYNNNIGLPLTVLNLSDEKIAVLEMGMDKFGEIDYLSKIVKPDIGVITNIGYSHIEKLGSRENILKAKAEIAANISGGGFLLLNGDDEYLPMLKSRTDVKTVYFGCENKDCDITFRIKDEKNGDFELGGYSFNSGLPGRHNIYNAAAAVIIGQYLKLTNGEIQSGLDSMELTGMRLSFEKTDGYTVICDCYNAAPDSMKASLKVLKDAEGERKIAVLASINELGDLRDSLLYEVGKTVAELKIDKLITVGEEALYLNKGASENGLLDEINFKDNDSAKKYILDIVKEGDVILVKGSRGFKLEEICEYLRKDETNA